MTDRKLSYVRRDYLLPIQGSMRSPAILSRSSARISGSTAAKTARTASSSSAKPPTRQSARCGSGTLTGRTWERTAAALAKIADKNSPGWDAGEMATVSLRIVAGAISREEVGGDHADRE